MLVNKSISAFIFVIIFVFMIALPISAQESQKLIPENKFTFSYDYALFRSQYDFVLLELYYSILRDRLKFEPTEDNKWMAEFTFTAEVWQNDSMLAATPWKNVDLIDSLSQIKAGQRLYGLGFFALRPDDYILKLELKDLHSGFSKKFETDISIQPFSKEHLTLSDIQFASRISRAVNKNRFYKNGYMVIPNSDRFYGTGMPMLMFYTEIYNLKKEDEPDTTQYVVNYKIIDSDGQVVREFPNKIRKKPGNSAVEVSGMNIISFRSGTYFLEVNVRDLFSQEVASKRKKFFIYREGELAISDSLANVQMRKKIEAMFEKIYSEMSAEEIDDEFGAASYIATREEKKVFKSLDITGKRAFLVEFWKKRDETPETPKNEFRDRYLSLVNTANQQFTGFRKGWKSDRGRILLTYGVPDEIERFPYSAEHKPYVIWKYFSIQGGVIFIFVDKRDLGRYELVHSTARGELNDPEWQRWIQPIDNLR